MKNGFALAVIVSFMAASVAPAQPQNPAPASPTPGPSSPGAEDPPPPAAPKPAVPTDEMKKLEEAAKVGPNQRLLDHMAGEWTLEIKDLTPDAETTDTGTMSGKMVLGGRFLSMDVDGRTNKKPFHGMGLWGYSNVDKRFESTWSDSMGTGIMVMTGSASEDRRTITMTGEMTDPITLKKLRAREVTTFHSRDAFHSDFYVESDGKEQKVMEINYKRVQPAEKPVEPKKAEEKPKGK